MTNIKQRIEKVEKLVGVDDKDLIVVVIRLELGRTVPRFDEPVEDWLIYREGCAEARRTGMPFIVVGPDAWSEYEVRNGLEPGTLTNHPFRGKLPFEELLKAAGCQAEVE